MVTFLRRLKTMPMSSVDATGVSDAHLVAQAQANPQAFEALYLRYLEEVSRFCYARLRDDERARDATQQTFTRALMALPAYHEQGQFRGWLYAIARSVIANDTRATRPQQTLDAAGDLAAREESLEEATIAAMSRRTLLEAIARLPDDQRDAIALRIAGLTGVQVATAMGRSHDSVRMLQRRAIDRLRRELVSPTKAAEGRHGT